MGNSSTVFIPVDHVKDARAKKKSHQAFYTPKAIIDLMTADANWWPGCRILEPSAGDGRIAWEFLQLGLSIDVCEIDDAMRQRCADLGATVVGSDFLKYRPDASYDLIVMNPPFTRGQDRLHIEHAYSMLGPFGQLISVAPTSLARNLCEGRISLPQCDYAVYERLGPDRFQEQGTKIETLLVTILNGPSEEIDGFANQPTFNAAMTIVTDAALLAKARISWTPEAYRQLLAGPIADSGGSTFGVHWDEVAEHVRAQLTEQKEAAGD